MKSKKEKIVEIENDNNNIKRDRSKLANKTEEVIME